MCLDEVTGVLSKQVLFFLYIINYHRSLLSERKDQDIEIEKEGERGEKEDEEKRRSGRRRNFLKTPSGVIATIKNIQI